MPLTLRYHGQTAIPVEMEGITPDAIRGKPLAEIEHLTIFHGNEKLALAEMFDVSGSADELRMEFQGDLDGVHWIGAHMRKGHIDVDGDVGRHLGSEMWGGEICVTGDAGDWVGGEMHGGRICVCGRAGHLIGAAYRGSRQGMTGGTIEIHGKAGNEIGHTMRRGWISIGQRAGDMIGFNMIAGTIFVFGECGIRPGAGMRRGTVGLFHTQPVALLPTFRYGCRYRPVMLDLMFRQLVERGFPVHQELFSTSFDLYHGDMIEQGRGEIVLRHVQQL